LTVIGTLGSHQEVLLKVVGKAGLSGWQQINISLNEKQFIKVCFLYFLLSEVDLEIRQTSALGEQKSNYFLRKTKLLRQFLLSYTGV